MAKSLVASYMEYMQEDEIRAVFQYAFKFNEPLSDPLQHYIQSWHHKLRPEQ